MYIAILCLGGYGRKTMTGLLRSQGSQERVRKSLSIINPTIIRYEPQD